MARPRIGIFGALVAVGSVLAWRWAQRHRASQTYLNRDLNRWEGEGGAVAATTQTAPGMQVGATPPAPGAAGGNGSTHPGGSGDAWPFPHS
ncbi:hypothetical protein [Paraburkholderia sp. BL10I2N1]|uniref:hypothetical protein n=1 Tax=Paraburkholderia sp. BL10I2N1 TaxID=1938796 RepID=UPI00105C1DF6|nr:hypothetical protein [Paraburkholderia sp. BL10I2N1]TDN66916.1 hypothetical protein B0G77_0130 [Paraburkholderia sp. BL10I2N1]